MQIAKTLLKYLHLQPLVNKLSLAVFCCGLSLCFPQDAFAYQLKQVKADDNKVLLLDTYLDKQPLITTLDTYLIEDKLLIAVEPLFDNLTLRYTREKNTLRVWKNQQVIDIKLNGNNSAALNETGLWCDDGFYLYVDETTLSQLFNIVIHYNTERLNLNIDTKDFYFPQQNLEQLSLQRQREQAVKVGDYQNNPQGKLIADQYRMFTLPHGSFALNSTLSSEQKNNLNYSVQTVADVLYHSTSLTLNDSTNDDLTGRLNFSRYKTKPDELIAGAIDRYSFGDINNVADNLTTGTQSGVGFIFAKEPEQFRYRNIGTSITETAIPGWDAELYRNGQFIELKKVPNDGNLIFEDVETQYGNNHYEIKLYGPFGEKEVRTQDLKLDKNALAKGQLAYSVYGLDDRKRLINDESSENYSLNNKGASFSYGISDSWLIGLNYVQKQNLANDSQNLATLKNSLAFPGVLFNNEISLQQGAGYAQTTSISGNAFNRDTFTFLYESADDYQSGRINSAGIKRQRVDLSYSGDFRPWYYTLGTSYSEVDGNKSWQVRNFLARNIFNINFSNNLFYNRNEYENHYSDSINGSFVAAGSLTDAVRISAILDYRPDVSQVIQNASLSLGWRDHFDLYHNLRGSYRLKESVNKWNVNYNLSWSREQFQLQLAANYDAQSRWMLTLGVRFFLAYDYYNHQPIFSSQLAANSATINSYSYLDRNPNGWRDEGDWDLKGVKFTGNPAWQRLASDVNGKAILPGVPSRIPFKFNAQWQYGTKSLINDYVLYTHPGAYIDMNMPFYVTTDFSGFVYKFNYYQQQSPLSGVVVEILNNNDKLINITSTDIDGFYQFSDMLPGKYKVRVANDYLSQSGYTADTKGYQLTTPSQGGLIELPALNLHKLPLDEKKSAETTKELNNKNLPVERNVWLDDNDPDKGKIFNLKTTGNYQIQKSVDQPDSLPDVPVVRSQLPNEPVTRVSLPVTPIIRNQLSTTPISRKQLPVTPVTRTALPNEPITRKPKAVTTSIAKPSTDAQPYVARLTRLKPIERDKLPIKPIVRDRLPIQPIVRHNLPVDPRSGKLFVAKQNAQINTNAKANRGNNKAINTSGSKGNKPAIGRQNKPVNLATKRLHHPLYTLQLGAFSHYKSAQLMAAKIHNNDLLENKLADSNEKLAVIADDSSGEKLYRVLLGQFERRELAAAFADKILPQNISSFIRQVPATSARLLTKQTQKIGYVIQFMASHNQQQLFASAEKIARITQVNQAEKVVGNETWYCLISQVYPTKSAAKAVLAALSVKGWVANNVLFKNIKVLTVQ